MHNFSQKRDTKTQGMQTHSSHLSLVFIPDPQRQINKIICSLGRRLTFPVISSKCMKSVEQLIVGVSSNIHSPSVIFDYTNNLK